MNNFTYHNPTRIVFGRGEIAQLSRLVPAQARVLLVAGSGSIRSNGVWDQVQAAVGSRLVAELWGVEPNPRYETLMRGVDLLRQHRSDFILAVGGGSVLDGAKFIAAAALFEGGDPWAILHPGAKVRSAVPLGAVLTLPATGSEANGFAVISRGNEKLAFGSPHCFPRFSVLDPEVTYSLPPRQLANGLVDAFVHTMEQYLTYPSAAPVQDRMAEGVMRSLVELAPAVMSRDKDYDSRAAFFWATTVALNGILAVGVPQDWATHMIGHEITALHGIDHARTLAAVLPALLQERAEGKRDKLLQWADRVWDIRTGTPEERIAAAVARLRVFFESVGIPTRLSAHGVGPEVADLVASRLEARGAKALGEREDITPAVVRTILSHAL